MSRAVLLTGGWMHPASESQLLVDLLQGRCDEVDVVADPDQVATALAIPPDLLVVNACWFAMTDERYTPEQRAQNAVLEDPQRRAAIAAVLEIGTPLLAMHTAILCFDGWRTWVDALGARWNWSTSFHPPPERLVVEPGTSSAMLTQSFEIDDEEYQALDVGPRVTVQAKSSNGHPLVWTRDEGTGRVAVDLLGHGPASLGNPAHQDVMNNLISWLMDAPANESEESHA